MAEVVFRVSDAFEFHLLLAENLAEEFQNGLGDFLGMSFESKVPGIE